MKKNNEKCQIAGKTISSAKDLLDIGLPVDTTRMHIVTDCHERPRENGGPASLPVCRAECPFYEVVKL